MQSSQRRYCARHEHMTAVEHIKAAQRAKLVDEEGAPVVLDLMPPLTSDQIDSLQQQVGQPLPEELRTLLAFCSGIGGGSLEGIDFTGTRDRKSTRLNSSHVRISYAVF